jgi:pimeloyl-ACP methyl ester carboxylesterase
MVPSQNTLDLAARLTHSELVRLYPDAGHGAIFQNHDDFVAKALEFLALLTSMWVGSDVLWRADLPA